MTTMTLSPADARLRSTRRTAPRSTVKLTHRGRVVLLTVALLLALAVGVLISSGSVATERPGTPEPTRVVMVGTGDTLWGIAASIADDGDVREMVAKIQDLNALDGGMVVAGQRLRVPVE